MKTSQVWLSYVSWNFGFQSLFCPKKPNSKSALEWYIFWKARIITKQPLTLRKLISVSLMSVMVLKKPKNVKPVEALVIRSSMVILLKVLLQSSLECYGLHYGAGKSFKNYKMPMTKIGGLCKAQLKLANLFFIYVWF